MSMRPPLSKAAGMIADADDGINARPVVLGVCFFWGVACGFLFNAVHKPRPRPVAAAHGGQARRDGNQPALTPEMSRIKQRQEHQAAIKEVKPPSAQQEVGMAEPPVPGKEPVAGSMTGEYPPLPKFGLDPAVGLTGRTASKPALPLEVKEGPAPPLPASSNTHDEVEPPDLD